MKNKSENSRIIKFIVISGICAGAAQLYIKSVLVRSFRKFTKRQSETSD